MAATGSSQTSAIGLELTGKGPERECDDPNCPFHGQLKVRESKLIGEVASAGSEKTVVVKRAHAEEIPKYNRFERRRSSITAHCPPCLPVAKGDRVEIAECQPISKTKSYVVVSVLTNETEVDK